MICKEREERASYVSAVCLTGLYLRGAPRQVTAPVRRWAWVDGALRRRSASIGEAPAVLRDAGLRTEALILESPGLLAWAETVVDNRRVCTPVDTDYPRRWLTRLGDGAPAALWRCSSASTHLPTRLMLGVVGSRWVQETVLGFAREVGSEVCRLGFCVVSGGAVGCDLAALDGADSGLELLPYGFRHFDRERPALSLCEPDAPFTRPAAMERNALIYAASLASVVVHARFREGGTWTGATDALRRRLCPLVVREDLDAPAHRALHALGSRTLRLPSCLSEALSCGDSQQGLFDATPVPAAPVDFSYHEGVGR